MAVETTGCNPNSKSKGPKINPPPIPKRPAITPETKAYKGNCQKIFPVHFKSEE